MSDGIARVLVAEAVGTCLLLASVVGSGIMAERLCGSNAGLTLLVNTLATGAALTALILTFAPVSGAHFNPVVTLADACSGGVRWKDAPLYVAAQVAGALAGVATAHAMFELPLFQSSTHARSGASQWFSEFVATFGLLCVIRGVADRRPRAVPVAVAAYIVAAYWFTASTSFANPAVTVARAMTDTFTGIRPLDVPAFVASQITGALAATVLWRWLRSPQAKEVARADAAVSREGTRLS